MNAAAGIVRDPARVAQLVVATEASVAREVISLVADTSALLEGHFALQSGEHSQYFIRFVRIGQDEARAQEVARLLAATWGSVAPSGFTVLCPESAGAFLGSAIVAISPGSELAIARINASRRPEAVLRHGRITPGQPVIVVNDVVTTGASLTTLLDLAEAHGGAVRGIAVFAALKPGRLQAFAMERHLRHSALVHAQWPTFEPGPGCPGCSKGLPLLPASELN